MRMAFAFALLASDDGFSRGRYRPGCGDSVARRRADRHRRRRCVVRRRRRRLGSRQIGSRPADDLWRLAGRRCRGPRGTISRAPAGVPATGATRSTRRRACCPATESYYRSWGTESPRGYEQGSFRRIRRRSSMRRSFAAAQDRGAEAHSEVLEGKRRQKRRSSEASNNNEVEQRESRVTGESNASISDWSCSSGGRGGGVRAGNGGLRWLRRSGGELFELRPCGRTPAAVGGYGTAAAGVMRPCRRPVQYYSVQPQYYYVNQGPTYTGPGMFAPAVSYQQRAVVGLERLRRRPLRLQRRPVREPDASLLSRHAGGLDADRLQLSPRLSAERALRLPLRAASARVYSRASTHVAPRVRVATARTAPRVRYGYRHHARAAPRYCRSASRMMPHQLQVI